MVALTVHCVDHSAVLGDSGDVLDVLFALGVVLAVITDRLGVGRDRVRNTDDLVARGDGDQIAGGLITLESGGSGNKGGDGKSTHDIGWKEVLRFGGKEDAH